jgi:hypothetical protein
MGYDKDLWHRAGKTLLWFFAATVIAITIFCSLASADDTVRLPRPRDPRDVGRWGAMINRFLRVSHNEDGTLKGTAVSDANALVGLAYGGTGASLSDPGADRLAGWDDSNNTVDWFTAGGNLWFSTKTLDVNEAAIDLFSCDWTGVWGSGVGQVDLDDVPDGSTSKLGQDCSPSGSPAFQAVAITGAATWNGGGSAATNTHIGSDGKDHSDVVLNNTHRGSDGKNHSDVVLNNTHRSSDGTDHSNVVLNDAHRTDEDAVTGILKGDGAGNYSAAVAGTDYLDNIVQDTAPQLGGDLSGQSTYDITDVVELEVEGHSSFGGGSPVNAANVLRVSRAFDPGAGIGYGLNCGPTFTGDRDMVQAIGIGFNAILSPASTAARTVTQFAGGAGQCAITTDTEYDLHVTDLQGMFAKVLAVDSGGAGTTTVTRGSCFYADPGMIYGATITDQYAFYDPGQGIGTNDWGLGINTDNSYINGSLRIGSAVAPTVELDVTGSGLISGAFGISGNNYVLGKFRKGGDTELTISGGVVTVTKSYHSIDTQSDDPSDFLVTINGGLDGMELTIRANNSARSVVVESDDSGNLALDDDDGDFTMDNAQDTMTLIYDAGAAVWLETGRRNNGA